MKGWYVSEWKKYLQNQIVVKKWFREGRQTDPKREDETKRQWLTRIVAPRVAEGERAKAELKFDPEVHIQEIKFDGTTLDWRVPEIVIYLMEHVDYLRKDRNRRARTLAATLATTRAETAASDPLLEGNGDATVVADEDDDETLVIREMGAKDIPDMIARIPMTIRELRKWIPNATRCKPTECACTCWRSTTGSIGGVQSHPEQLWSVL